MQDAPKMLLVALVIYEVGINESTTMSKIFEAYRWYTEEVLKLNQQADKSTVKLWVVYLSNKRLMLRIKRNGRRIDKQYRMLTSARHLLNSEKLPEMHRKHVLAFHERKELEKNEI